MLFRSGDLRGTTRASYEDDEDQTRPGGVLEGVRLDIQWGSWVITFQGHGWCSAGGDAGFWTAAIALLAHNRLLAGICTYAGSTYQTGLASVRNLHSACSIRRRNT